MYLREPKLRPPRDLWQPRNWPPRLLAGSQQPQHRYWKRYAPASKWGRTPTSGSGGWCSPPRAPTKAPEGLPLDHSGQPACLWEGFGLRPARALRKRTSGLPTLKWHLGRWSVVASQEEIKIRHQDLRARRDGANPTLERRRVLRRDRTDSDNRPGKIQVGIDWANTGIGKPVPKPNSKHPSFKADPSGVDEPPPRMKSTVTKPKQPSETQEKDSGKKKEDAEKKVLQDKPHRWIEARVSVWIRVATRTKWSP